LGLFLFPVHHTGTCVILRQIKGKVVSVLN